LHITFVTKYGGPILSSSISSYYLYDRIAQMTPYGNNNESNGRSLMRII
jgi:hypothetical protein